MSNSIFYSVFFILLFSLFSSVLAQEKYEVNQKGEVRIKIEQPDKWHDETSYEQKARQNPDKQIS